MNLYHIERKDEGDYDTYSDAVVVAENATEAKSIHPRIDYGDKRVKHIPLKNNEWRDWPNDPDMVFVTEIGVASSQYTEETVICASFHAG